MKIFRTPDQSIETVSHDPELSKTVIAGGEFFQAIPQIATVVIAPGKGTSAHAHADMDEFFYIVNGSIEVVVSECTETLVTGEAILISAGEQHAFSNKSDTDVMMLYFGVVQSA